MKKGMTFNSIIYADIVIKSKKIEIVRIFDFNHAGKMTKDRLCQENDTSNKEGYGGIFEGKKQEELIKYKKEKTS